MRYSKSSLHSSNTTVATSLRGRSRPVPVRAGQCDAQLSLALEPGEARPAWVVRVKGDRMQQAGIVDGDLVAIQKNGQGRSSTLTVTRLDRTAEAWVSSHSALPAVTLWGKPMTLSSSSADIEGVFIGMLRKKCALH